MEVARFTIIFSVCILICQGYQVILEDEGKTDVKDYYPIHDTLVEETEPKKKEDFYPVESYDALKESIPKNKEDYYTILHEHDTLVEETEPKKKEDFYPVESYDALKETIPKNKEDVSEDVLEDELDEMLQDMDAQNTKRKALFFGFFSRLFGSRRRSSSSRRSGGSSSGGNSVDAATVKRECLSVHNAKRALHRNTPPMTYDDNLAKDCQKYAQYLASIGTMKHANGNFGENIYYAWSSAGKSIKGAARDASNSWYNEIHDYSFWTGRSKNGKKVGHFTQMVWDDSTKLGCGAGLSADGKTLMVVARYLPPGNYRGQYKQHVHPLK